MFDTALFILKHLNYGEANFGSLFERTRHDEAQFGGLNSGQLSQYFDVCIETMNGRIKTLKQGGRGGGDLVLKKDEKYHVERFQRQKQMHIPNVGYDLYFWPKPWR